MGKIVRGKMQGDADHSQLSSAQPRVAIDYASPATRRRWTLQQMIPAVVVVLLAGAYAIACRPAYWQSSWPPLGRSSQAWSWVWPPAAVLFLLLVPRSRWTIAWLAALAVLTAGIHAWTYPFVTMNPVRSWDWGMWMPNLIFTLPIHLIVTGILAGLCWALLAIFNVEPILSGELRPARARIVPMLLVIACIAAVPAIVYGYAGFYDHRDAATGAAMADGDWANHEPVIWSDDCPIYQDCGETSITSCLDPDLNIPIRQSWYRRFEPGYNAEIRRLMGHDKPAWLAKFPRIANQDMLRMQRSNGMKEITAYPYTLSANAIVIQGSTTLPWGASIDTNPGTIIVETSHQSNEFPLCDIDPSKPVFVGQLPEYPTVHFIRNGNTVVACSDDGWILETLMAK